LILVALGAGVLGALNVFFIQTNLHQSASLYGTIGLAEGIGGLLGGLMTGWTAAKVGAPRLFWGGLILAGIAIVGYSRMSNLFAALAFIAAVGLLLGGVGASNSALLLAVTPRHMIGRVMSVITPLAYLAAIVSLAAAGLLTSTVLHGFRATVADVTFGPYDTVIAVAGLLFIAAGLASIRPLRLRE
jgi:MFS family permease